MRYKLMTIKGCADDLFLQKMVKETFFKFFRNFFSFSIYKFCEEIINNLKFSTKRKVKIHNCILITPVIVSWIIFTFCVTSVLHADMARHLELSPESEGDRSKEVTIFNSITLKFQNRLNNWKSAQSQNGALLRTAVK